MAGAFAWTLVGLAVVASLLIAIQAARRPILFRMAARNASRRPKQTATVIAGLMIGTAIISAAIISGQSAGSAIRGEVYKALGPIDETVRLDSFNFFTEDVVDAFTDDPEAAAWFDGISANVIWDVSVSNPRTDLFEPRAAIVGFDPLRDADFGDFHFTDGTRGDARDLQRGTVILNEHLAGELDARVGDRIEVRYTRPVDPVIPSVTLIEDTLDVAAAGGLIPNSAVPPTATNTHAFTVDEGASRIVTVVAWNPQMAPGAPPTTSLHLRLLGPDGSVYETPPAASGGASALPPLWLNVTPPAGTPVAVGSWELQVSAPFAFDTAYVGAAVVLYPVYDVAELQQRFQELREQDLGEFEELADFAAFGEPEQMEVTVAGITDGGRGNQFDFEDAVFLHLDDAQEAFGREGQINVLKMSNPGTTKTGGASTDEALQRINATLDSLRADRPDDAALEHVGPHPVKRDFLNLADEAGQLMTGLLLFAGSLSVITGLLLIINIFTMLAEERRTDLGMSRAVGMTRRDLVRLFLFEGSLYAVAAAAIGSILGLGLAAALVAFINMILRNLGAGFPSIPLLVTFDALLVSFAAGALLTFVTILVASRRIARLNIVRAIRRIDEPDRQGTPLQAAMGALLVVLGAVATTVGWAVPGFEFRLSLQVFGPLVMAIGASMTLRRWLRRRLLYPSLSAVLAGYYTMTYFLITKYDNIEEANIVGPMRGVILTLCVVVIAVHFEAGPRWLGRALGRFRNWRPIALPAVAYPQHKRFRTGMTLAMFSIVILSIGFFSIFGGLFDQPVETQTGGFHVEATTTLDVDDLSEYDRGLVPAGTIEAVVRVSDFFTPDVTLITVNGERTGQFNADVGHHVYGIDQDFVDEQNFRLLWRLPEYADDHAAYQALLERDDVAIVAYPYSTDERNQDLSHEVGEPLQVHLGDEVREYTIIGIQEQYHLVGVFMARDEASTLFPTTSDDFYLYRLSPGQDSVATAKLLEQNYREVGLNAESSEEEVREEQQTFRQVLAAMKLFLGLGLLVGVLSLGIVTSRSVLERRQEIGMMRALGYTPGMVRRIFLTEVTFVVFLGAIIGVACSIVVSFGLWYAIIRELQYPYQIPWSEIGILLLVSYAVAMMATLAPIRRAAKVAPAEALRYIE